MAASIAASIFKHFDLGKSRPAPKETRAEKALRNHKALVAFHASVRNGAPLSVRSLAKQFGLSTTTAHRLISSSFSGRSSSALSTDAQAIVSILQDHLPHDGRRLVDCKALLRCAGVKFDRLEGICSELNEARQPFRLFATGHPSFTAGSHWLVVDRGRQKSQSDLEVWAHRAIAKVAVPSRRLDQRRIIVLENVVLPRNPVLRDLASVLLVVSGYKNLMVWRRFVSASTKPVLSVTGISIADPEALITALNGAFRLSRIEAGDLASKVSGWIADGADRAGSKQLLDLVYQLAVDEFEPWGILDRWIAKTDYIERVNDGSLPGRAPEDVESLTRFRGVNDGDELLNSFLRQSSDKIIPGGAHTLLDPDFSEMWEDDETSRNEEDGEAESDDWNSEGYIYPPVEEELEPLTD